MNEYLEQTGAEALTSLHMGNLVLETPPKSSYLNTRVRKYHHCDGIAITTLNPLPLSQSRAARKEATPEVIDLRDDLNNLVNDLDGSPLTDSKTYAYKAYKITVHPDYYNNTRV
jgi:hypothetical protein